MIKAKKKFGQNFLQDDSVIERIIQAFSPRPEDCVYEIGPGHGALTEHLATLCEDLNLVEIDRDLIELMEHKFAKDDHIKIHPIDALTLDLQKQNTRIIGNLPYNISTPLLIRFLYQSDKISDMVFMLQKEVVQRICAPCGVKAYGRLSVMMQYAFDCEPLFVVKPQAFIPAPKVDSQIVRLKKRDHLAEVSLPILEETVKRSFAQRRKTIRNNLKSLLSADQLEELDIDPGCRAETLTVNEFVKLANAINS